MWWLIAGLAVIVFVELDRRRCCSPIKHCCFLLGAKKKLVFKACMLLKSIDAQQ